MNRTKHFLFAALGIIAIAAVVRAAEMKFSLPPETATLKPGPGAELATANCLLCHSADYIATQPRLSRTVWKAEVIKMQQKYGAPVSTNNVDQLVDYLVKNYGQETKASNLPIK
jgi:mono/diheme cytochrome c family protein